jgi:hypothetical protein
MGWFRRKARSPVAEQERRWLDERWRWLQKSFGIRTPARVDVVVPTEEFFPEAYDFTFDAAAEVIERVRQYMDLADQQIDFFFYSSEDPWGDNPHVTGGERDGAAGVYEHAYGGDVPRIGIDVRKIEEPISLVATVAHELGHVHLIGGGRLSGDEPDHEPLTDLCTVFLGLGVFTASSAVRQVNYSSLMTEGWSVGRLGYLRQEEYGHALALFARARGEDRPAWLQHVCVDVRSYCKQSMRYLAEEML